MITLSSNIISTFTQPWNGNVKVYKQLKNFASTLGWYPSDIIEEKSNYSLTTGHLFVEHGLENSAVISFINNKYFFETLSFSQQIDLLNVSYNNLTDLHISVDISKINGLNNRLRNDTIFYSGQIDYTFSNLKSDFFSSIIEQKRIRPVLDSLDDSLIKTISYWKRFISAELNNQNINEEFANLFNAIIFARSAEDYFKKTHESFISEPLLIQFLYNRSNGDSLFNLFESVLKKLRLKAFPKGLFEESKINFFNKLDNNLLGQVFKDFYTSRFTPYQYDFSIISKHALSRIYERYVSILKVENKPQLSFFPEIPLEETNKNSGTYYTPQFIARFFSRYIERNLQNYSEATLKVIEPAVGSGIFLRTILENKCDFFEDLSIPSINNAFENIVGIDNNTTACQAAKLSLTLLYLVTTGTLPKKELNIINEDSLDYLSKKSFNNDVDICISNPPYVPYNKLTPEIKVQIKKILEDTRFGRYDLYFPFLKFAVEMLKTNGMGFFVLPNTFLTIDSAKGLRKFLAQNTFIKCIIDLSEVKVFEDIGVYTILLIFEKFDAPLLQKNETFGSIPVATIAKINDNIGEALDAVLNNKKVEKLAYSIYDINQQFFKQESWELLPPAEFTLKRKLDVFKKLKDFADIRTGFSTGNDDAFLVEKKDIMTGEEDLYIPHLSDREMSPYEVPNTTEKYFVYPFFEDNSTFSERHFKIEYPQAYKRIEKFKNVLNQRADVKRGERRWWEPHRPRKRDFMLVPKITTPYLVITPKYSFDSKGKFAISRSPFIVLRPENKEDDLYYYLLAVLNSSICFWYLIKIAPKYAQGYAVLEKGKYLSELPIPDPFQIDRKLFHDLITLVKKRIKMKSYDALFLEKQIEEIIIKLYNLTDSEKEYLNIR